MPPNTDAYPAGLAEELKKACPHLHLLDPVKLSEKIGDTKFLNVALLGYLSVYLDIPETAWQKAIEAEIPAGFFEQNWEAFRIGKQSNVPK
jgi:indolepyruvate ferredoxin oxidoreductase beta subunit